MPDKDTNAMVESPQQFVNTASTTSKAAAFLNSGLSINALRTNDLLRYDEWKDLDERVVQVARERLIAVADLQSAGLTLDLGGLGTMLSEYEQQSDMTAANVDMSGVAPGEEDSVGYTLVSIPVPIVHKDFRINIRRLMASRKMGQSIDTVQAETAARKVRDGLEDLVLNGSTNIVVNANNLYGYTTHPDRNTLSATGDWGTIANIYTDALRLVAAAEADNMFGPFTMYVATTQYGEMRNLYTDGAPESALERVSRGLPIISSIKPVDRLTAGSVVLVQMTRDVVDLAVGQDITTVEWDTYGGLVSHFKVMACMAPRVKSDDEGQSGVVHMTGA